MSLRKGYSDGPQGQLHWRRAGTLGTPGRPDLYCFSPAPFGSIAYSNLLPHLATDRGVVAPDYPGQGGSDGDSVTPSIEEYAASMAAIIHDLSQDTPVSVFGFHSGCLVAIELALTLSDKVDQVVLVDVPAFDPDTRAKYLPMVGAPFEPSADAQSVAKSWDMAVTKRRETQSLEQCFAMFADTVGNGPRINATFHAAFTYDVESKFAALKHKTTIIATQSSLLAPSQRAAQLISGAKLVELLEVQRSVLDENAQTTADAVLAALD